MTYPIAYYFTSFCFFALWTLLFARGAREGMLRHYRWFYLYVAVSAGAGIARLLAAHLAEGGVNSWAYYYVYYGAAACEQLAAISVLLRLYRLDGQSLRMRSLMLAALPALAVLLVSFAATDSHILNRLANAGHCFLAFAAFAVLLRWASTPELYPGRNAKAMLCVIFVPNFIASCNLMLLFSERWPEALFRHLEEPVGLIAWFVAYLGLRSFEPPVRVGPIDQAGVWERLVRGLRIARDAL